MTSNDTLAPDDINNQNVNVQELVKLVTEQIQGTQHASSLPTTIPTTQPNVTPPPPLRDVRPTGIAELDQILNGGLPKNATVILAGGPGTGKTTLALQWLVEGYKQFSEPGLFITATEPINKALSNFKKHEFAKNFEMSNNTIVFEDLRTIIGNLGMHEENLANENLDKIIDAISDLILKSGAKRVVIDSITALAYGLQEKSQIRKFIHHMDALISLEGVNIILISESSGSDYSIFGVEEFIADGIIRMSRVRENGDLVRYLEIIKMRTVAFNSQPVSYKITANGIKLFPRIEYPLTYKSSTVRISTGIPGLDEMIGGGFLEGSTILLSGTSGAGKSIFSLQFLTQRFREKQKAILISFEESKEQIYRNAKSFSWDLESYEKEGLLNIITVFAEEKYPEEHLLAIRELVEKTQARFLIFDSISAIENAFSVEVIRDMLPRLNAYLKSRSVTTIYTNTSKTLLGSSQVTDSLLSTIPDQIIMLRYVEIQSKLRHALLNLKMRGSKHDNSLREIIFTSSGLQISGDFSGMEGILTGSARQVSKSTEEQLHSLFLETLGPMGETIFSKEKKKGLTDTNIEKMILELGNQGILPLDKKKEFLDGAKAIFG